MGWYLRKSLGFGPLRLNLSRSGLGLSLGVTGARIGIGPRGSYVHVGRGGLYYRQSLGSGRAAGTGRAGMVVTPALPEIESVAANEMHDSSSEELIQELSRVQRRISSFPPVLCLLVILAGMLFAMAGHEFLARPAPPPPAPPVQESVSLADVLRSRVIAPPSPQVDHERLWLFICAGLVLVATGVPLALYARHRDVTNGTAVLMYDLDADSRKAFSSFTDAFSTFAGCARVWHVSAGGDTDDWKRQAGARRLVERSAIAPGLSLPRRVQSNLQVPMLLAGRQQLYFFPDRLLVYDSSGIGSIPYPALIASAGKVHFREDGDVPSDSQTVGTSWRFVNRDGGPDRRFKGNREIPIVEYGHLSLTSDSGLNEVFQCSRPDAAAPLVASLRGIGSVVPGAQGDAGARSPGPPTGRARGRRS